MMKTLLEIRTMWGRIVTIMMVNIRGQLVSVVNKVNSRGNNSITVIINNNKNIIIHKISNNLFTITPSHNHHSNKWAYQNSANSAESAKPVLSAEEKPNTPVINSPELLVKKLWHSYSHVKLINKIDPRQ